MAWIVSMASDSTRVWGYLLVKSKSSCIEFLSLGLFCTMVCKGCTSLKTLVLSSATQGCVDRIEFKIWNMESFHGRKYFLVFEKYISPSERIALFGIRQHIKVIGNIKTYCSKDSLCGAFNDSVIILAMTSVWGLFRSDWNSKGSINPSMTDFPSFLAVPMIVSMNNLDAVEVSSMTY